MREAHYHVAKVTKIVEIKNKKDKNLQKGNCIAQFFIVSDR